jgi:hypothetical protein
MDKNFMTMKLTNDNPKKVVAKEKIKIHRTLNQPSPSPTMPS